MSSNKKPTSLKTLEEEGEDRISTLPDDVLSHILSLLPTKTSVSTTILSSRWLNLFATVPVLNFDDSLTSYDPIDTFSFSCFVIDVLCKVMRKIAHIGKFRVNCRGTYTYSMIATWISAATIGNLQHLDVSANMTNSGPLPQRLLSCRTLVDLKLHGKFCLYVPEDVIFPCLKTIELIEVVMVDDAGVRRFFSGCHVLEHLYLSTCVLYTINVFEVSVPSLKHLHMGDINDSFEFRLNAPSLNYFYCQSYAARGYSGDNTLSSLKKAFISIILEDEQFEEVDVSGLVNLVPHTRSLTLDNYSMKASLLLTFLLIMVFIYRCLFFFNIWYRLEDLIVL